jgi:hypothetical protein
VSTVAPADLPFDRNLIHAIRLMKIFSWPSHGGRELQSIQEVATIEVHDV